MEEWNNGIMEEWKIGNPFLNVGTRHVVSLHLKMNPETLKP
jgi:hypothetical protein